jgi:hydroxyethylthiazole kinase-like uncharacterized protein yjeF
VKVVTAAQMRAIEAATEAAGTPTSELMQQAGLSAAQAIWRAIDGDPDRPVLLLVGPGNNGGDGLVAATGLREAGADVHVYLLRERPDDDAVWRAAQQAGVPATIADDDPGLEALDALLADATCVVDGLLGTGNSRPLGGQLAEVMTHVAEARAARDGILMIALDLPTGVDPDTGAADPLAVAADVTICFGYLKVGLTQSPGRLLAGDITIAPLELPAAEETALPYTEIDPRLAQLGVMPRPPDANKGTFGHATIAAGSTRFPGAARLAAEAAARSGTGLTTLAVPAVVQSLIAPAFPDATYEPLPSSHGAMRGAEAARALLRALPGADALLVGPGLSLTPATQEFTCSLLAGLDAVEGLRAVVLDADALNALAGHPGWPTWSALPRVLTPHPGEMARLIHTTIPQVQADRLAAALHAARETRSVVILKGAGTIVAAPDGRAAISRVANSMLATGGTGDVLAGLVVGLIAQGAAPFEAATTAVYLHAVAAAEVARDFGIAAGIAIDLLRALPVARRTLDTP